MWNYLLHSQFLNFHDSDVGDIVMFVTKWCWPILDVGDRSNMFFRYIEDFPMYQIGCQHPNSATNISKLSPTHFVSKSRHQHWCNLTKLLHFRIEVFENSVSFGYQNMARQQIFEVTFAYNNQLLSAVPKSGWTWKYKPTSKIISPSKLYSWVFLRV